MTHEIRFMLLHITDSVEKLNKDQSMDLKKISNYSENHDIGNIKINKVLSTFMFKSLYPIEWNLCPSDEYCSILLFAYFPNISFWGQMSQ